MLSTHNPSSIQKRRQQHRRQQSLEVPILATPLPANPRRTKGSHTHRRGLSLDQSLSALNSATSFRPLLPQDQDPHHPDQDHFQGPSPVRIEIDTTNLGHPTDHKHFVQETQQHHTPAQPGYQAQDFQAHLQRQLQGNVSPIAAPTPTNPSQQQALQELQHHLEWYQQNFGHSPTPNMQNSTAFNFNQPISAAEMSMNPMHAQMQLPIRSLTNTPVSHGHGHPHTMPNTPQQYTQSWPSPPATNQKHVRSQSFQLDVAPMPTSFDGGQIMNVTSSNLNSSNVTSPYPQPHIGSAQASFNEHYASSNYSSSVVDPMSPSRQNNAGPMPTLYEEPLPMPNNQPAPNGFDEAALLQAAEGAEDELDFNSPNFMVGGGSTMGMSPRTALLHSLGDDVNASIIDTGIPPEVIEGYIKDPPKEDPDKKWWCLFEENGKMCDKWFKRRENARSHVQNHLDDRQFQCNDCLKTFVRAHDMKRHAAIHKDDRPHACICGSTFARHDALTRHRQRGMCEGALPGYEKAPEDKPKRGRPKKERPDMETRTSKAKRAREIDRKEATVASAAANYASSSSGASQHSGPMTPPDTDNFDADVWIEMMTTAGADNTGSGFWQQTPPTSPISASFVTSSTKEMSATDNDTGISPALLIASSPPDHTTYGDMDFGVLDANPDVARMDLFGSSDELSPPSNASFGDASPPSLLDNDGDLDSLLSKQLVEGIAAAHPWERIVRDDVDFVL